MTPTITKKTFRCISLLVRCSSGEQNKEDRWAEVQKKITPWKSGLQEHEAELQLVPQQRAVRLGKQHGALVVVASLIDKPTNLGGEEQRFFRS